MAPRAAPPSLYIPQRPRALVLTAAGGDTALRDVLLRRQYAVLDVASLVPGELVEGSAWCDLGAEMSAAVDWVGRHPEWTLLPLALLGQHAAAGVVVHEALPRRTRVSAVLALSPRRGVVLQGIAGLTVPTLIVAEDVNRRTRRRTLKQLPRGSQVVRAHRRAESFELAACFLDQALAASVRAGRHRAAGPSRARVAARVGSATAIATAAVLGLAPASSSADCAMTSGGGLLTIQCDGGDASTSQLAVNNDGQFLLDGSAIDGATVAEIKLVTIIGGAGDNHLVIDERQGKFGTTVEGEPFQPIEFKIDLAEGADLLSWLGSGEADSLKLALDGIDVLADDSVDFALTSVESLKLDFGAGDDKWNGGKWSGPLSLDAGDGLDLLKLTTDEKLVTLTDTLVTLSDGTLEQKIDFAAFESLSYLGGVGDNTLALAGKFDQLKLSLDGGAGDGLDLLKLTTDDKYVTLTDTLVTLSDGTLDQKIDFAAFESLTYLGGAGDNTLALAGLKLPLTVDGGGGTDLLKLTTDSALVTLSETAIKLDTSAVNFTSFESMSYLGGAGATTFALDGFKLPLTMDGGGGLDAFKLTSESALVTLSGTSVKLDTGALEFNNFDALTFVGGTGDSTVTLDGFKLPVTVDGGGGTDLLKLASDSALVTLSDTKLTFDTADVDHKAFESLTYLGGAAANTFDGSKVTLLKLSLDGGAGNDVLKGGTAADSVAGGLGNDVVFGGLGDDKLSGGLGTDKLSGDGGIDTLYEQGDVNFLATSTTLQGLGSDTLATIERLHLVGGVRSNTIDASKFKAGFVTLDGGGADDVLIGTSMGDILRGGANDDRLLGGGGNDAIYGDAGDDFLDGAEGTDFGDGGLGDDAGKRIENALSIEH
jgi:Ca2+-binding RTX toxin-like protein